VLVALAVLTTACQEGTWTGEPSAPSVVLIGDSLTYRAEQDPEDATQTHLLTEAIVAEGWYAYVTGFIGNDVLEAHQSHWVTPSRMSEPDPDALVLALGTNDMRDTEGAPALPLDVVRHELESWLGELEAGTCVRLVGVAENVVGTWRLDLWGPAYNLMLAEVAAAFTELDAQYVEWAPPAEWLAGWTGGDTAPDPHHEAAGRVAYRQLLVDTVNSCV
jgi:hypothetical protein